MWWIAEGLFWPGGGGCCIFVIPYFFLFSLSSSYNIVSISPPLLLDISLDGISSKLKHYAKEEEKKFLLSPHF